MLKSRLCAFFHTSILLLFAALLLFTPLLVTPFNYELFEFNKMLFVYTITVLIIALWLGIIITGGKKTFKTTPLDSVLILFLAAQIISTLLSKDIYLSIWGYYGRFNGGLLSYLCYLLLYYAFINNVRREHISKLLRILIVSGIIVSIYAVFQRVGIDAHLWVQDVQSRVFSTLGQPNWLAALLAILIPLSLAKALAQEKKKGKSASKFEPRLVKRLWNLFRTQYVKFFLISNLFYIALIFTKSRSGLAGFWIANIFFWLFVSRLHCQAMQARMIRMIVLFNVSFAALTIIFSPFDRIALFHNQPTAQVQPPTTNSLQLTSNGVTDSFDIRKIVWKGALNAVKERPLLGWGPETFAWAYYQNRPVEHNLTSEWDFLYNKAHNEYINYAVTIGLAGLGAYLLIIGAYIVWFIRTMRSILLARNKSGYTALILISLFAGWVSILVTNFFGFSVVVTALLFYIIPAMSFTLITKRGYAEIKEPNNFAARVFFMLHRVTRTALCGAARSFQPLWLFSCRDKRKKRQQRSDSLSFLDWLALLVITFLVIFLLSGIVRYYRADYYYAKAIENYRNSQYAKAYNGFHKALKLRPFDPVYQNRYSETLAMLSLGLYEQGQEEYKDFIQSSLYYSAKSLKTSPYNISFWKARTRTLYALSQIDPVYGEYALEAIETARSIAPTDAKIVYNKAIVLDELGKRDEAIDTLKQAINLKKDYKDAAWALAVFYESAKDKENKDYWLNYILKNIDSQDAEVKKKLGIGE